MADIDRNIEIELKLRAASRDMTALERAASRLGTAMNQPHTAHLVTRYFDSDDLALAKRGVALRLRLNGDQYVQGIKARPNGAARNGSGSSGVARAEWEWPVEEPELDLRRLTTPPVAKLIPPHAAASLHPVFATDIHRTEIEIRPDDTTRVKVAFDRGKIVAGTRSAPVAEIELELAGDSKNGQEGVLYRLALALLRVAPMTIETVSKGDRGYQLIDQRKSEAVKAGSLTLTKSHTVRDGFRLILRHAMGQLLANQAPALDGAEVDGVHQMRVAARRLRSAIRLFRPVADSPEMRWLDAEVKWLGRELGRARDWDVFATATLDLVKPAEAARRAAEAIAKPVARSRHEAHAAVREIIQSPRYTTLILTFGALIDEDGWHDGSNSEAQALIDRPLVEVAPQWLARLAHKVEKTGRRIAKADAAERHKLRKASKRLRYASQFLGSLYRRKRVARYSHRLSELQDVLGSLNDIATARKMLAELSRSGSRSEASLLLAELRQREKEALGDLAKAWGRFGKVAPYWD